MNKQIIETTKAPAAIGPYSQAIKSGSLIFVSGQIPVDPETGNLVIGGIESETLRVMKNISIILVAAGSSLSRIVKTSIYLKNMDDFAKVNEIYGSFFKDDFPARETVEVSRLPKDVDIEISVIASVWRLPAVMW